MEQAGIRLAEIWAQTQASVRLVVELLLAILLALMVGQVGWMIAAPSDAVAVLSDRPLPAPLTFDRSTISANRTLLVEQNPFESSAPVLQVEAPETQLNLSLRGFTMSTAPGGGGAYITTPDNRTQRFVPGEEVLEGVVLERILSDRVLLSRGGVTEVLIREGRTSGLTVVGDASQTRDGSQIESAVPPPTQSETEGAIADPQSLLRTVRLSPAQREGRLYGYTVNLSGSQAALDRSGLQVGDVVLEVNGTQASEIDFAELIEEIGSGRSTMVRVEREGAQQTVRIRFEE